MTHKPLIPLITLLRLLNNQFGSAEQRRLESKIREDSLAFARWQRLQDAVGSATTLNLNEKSYASTDQEYELQRIAAFLDGTLSDEESLAFENECWESENLLHDVVVLFRAGIQSKTSDKVDSNAAASLAQQRQLRDRLVGLFPAEPPPAATPERLSKNISTKTKPTLSNLTKVAIAVAAALAMVAFSIVIANWNALTPSPTTIQRTDVPPEVLVETPQAPKESDKRIEPPRVVGTEHRDKIEDVPDSIDREQIVDLPSTVDQPPDTEKPQPDSVAPEPQVVQSPDVSPDSDVSHDNDGPNDLPIPRPPKLVDDGMAEPANQPTKIQWSWDRIEGLVATRTGTSRRWSGASPVDVSSHQLSDDSDSPDTDRINADGVLKMECKVLPMSWGQATVTGMGSWTVTENTDFSVGPIFARQIGSQLDTGAQANDRSKSVIGAKINLRRGGLAISNANVGSVFLIETATGDWRIRITDPATVVVVEQLSASRLVVQKGSIRVNRKELTARQQLVRSADGKLEQMPNRDSIKWLKKPVDKFPSKQLSAQWQASRDLFTDLARLNTIAPEDQPLVRFALATIDPPGQAKLYLASALPEVRAEGIHWLLAFGNDPRRLRRLAGALATEMNSPSIGENLPRLVLAIQAKRLPAKADADLLVTGLQNRNVSVRRFSHSLLVHMFGALEDYNPEANPTTQTTQTRKWSSAVTGLYRRVENAR